ncbi:MAG: sulfur carrier protein ThiS [Solirubrobacteraceae bacterium]
MVQLNGAAREVGDEATVAELLTLLEAGIPTRGVAVAVDEEVVPRARWEATRLRAGARVEVVSAIQGG